MYVWQPGVEGSTTQQKSKQDKLQEEKILRAGGKGESRKKNNKESKKSKNIILFSLSIQFKWKHNVIWNKLCHPQLGTAM